MIVNSWINTFFRSFLFLNWSEIKLFFTKFNKSWTQFLLILLFSPYCISRSFGVTQTLVIWNRNVFDIPWLDYLNNWLHNLFLFFTWSFVQIVRAIFRFVRAKWHTATALIITWCLVTIKIYICLNLIDHFWLVDQQIFTKKRVLKFLRTDLHHFWLTIWRNISRINPHSYFKIWSISNRFVFFTEVYFLSYVVFIKSPVILVHSWLFREEWIWMFKVRGIEVGGCR